jgi:type II secretory ATPase GspE/PulE/Tfp pilus assembly ATPase PilB-like protein
VAQRLVRRLCTECRVESAPDQLEQRMLRCEADAVLYAPLGCKHCYFTGYRGRIALIEIVRWTRELGELLSAGATLGELQKVATQQGFIELADVAVRRILAGDTTLEEAARVIDLTERAHG